MLGYEDASKKFRTEPCEDVVKCDWTTEEIAKSFIEDVEAVKDQLDGQFIDAVSREAVIRLVEQYPNIIGNRCSGLISDIKHLPSVKPKYTDEEIDKAQAVEQAYVDKMVELAVEETKRPKGKWIRVVDKAGHWVWECDCKWQQRFATNYCPNCGAEMSGGEEDV